ncbi:porin [Vibrio sp. SCSIO 43140]|uniref:oligogalacturonate-specific porin KdgM family protein n=1 Tax=Vibrio sp. SCSIO 43140 TaxID=2819100 RepID=UPI0020758BAF|nr:oligogalacturonate-specific porin KdgM family protein [Vibrio sp. SCSIO 43140]USD59820.1 porin [Vibrio sp. SCSIO 43140]
MRLLIIVGLLFASLSASAASSYIEGNIQFNSTYLYDSKTTAKMEAGHTFDTDTTVRFIVEDIPIGKTPYSHHNHHNNVYYGHSARAPLTTLGVEQKFQMSKNFWLGAGYEHLMQLGETVQYRPLFKIGYDFDEGLSLSHRTRVEAYAKHDRWGYKPDIDYRFDSKVEYQLKTHPIKLHYNNVYHMSGAYHPYYPYTDNAMDHEFRLTLTKFAFQPYFEYKNQGTFRTPYYPRGTANSAIVVGGTYHF